jgi:hypothetical protein
MGMGIQSGFALAMEAGAKREREEIIEELEKGLNDPYIPENGEVSEICKAVQKCFIAIIRARGNENRLTPLVDIGIPHSEESLRRKINAIIAVVNELKGAK